MKRTLFALTAWLGLVLLAPAERAHATETLADALIDLPQIRGEAIQADDLDDKVVLVAFFASWCPPCKHEFPHLNTVQKAYGDDGFKVIAVNVFEAFEGRSTPEKLDVFLDDVKPIFPIIKGNDETRRIFGDLDRIPTMFVFGRDGAPEYIFRHKRNAEKTHLTEEELREVIEPLL
ncbi:MAG: TlpA disulfide reductase family protein [Geminicoccaceae bacterium]